MTTLYTHIGGRPHVGYAPCGARLWGHAAPVPGKQHALNGGPDLFTALCGASVELVRVTEFGEPATPNVQAVGVTGASGVVAPAVTCGRCRRLLGLARYAVQFRVPGVRKWFLAKGHADYPVRADAEAALPGLQQAHPHCAFRVRLL